MGVVDRSPTARFTREGNARTNRSFKNALSLPWAPGYNNSITRFENPCQKDRNTNHRNSPRYANSV